MSKKINFGKIAITGGGAAAGGAAVVVAGKFSPLSPMITNGLLLVAGAVIPEFAPKSDLIQGMGLGIAGAASAKLLESFVPALSVVSGAEDIMNGVGEAIEVDSEYEDNVSGSASDVMGKL